MTTRGHVFLVYTSKGSWFSNASLKDDQGTEYRVEGNFQPYMGDTSGKMVNGFKVNGERLQGLWFVPTEESVGAWRPRTLKLELFQSMHVVLEPIRKQIANRTYPHKNYVSRT